jgi:hypothetical protein
MTSRWLRLSLVFLAALVVAGAGYVAFKQEAIRSATEARTAALETETRELMAKLDDVRASQQSYVAAGQNADFWTARADRDMTALETELKELDARASSAPSQAALDKAATMLERLRKTDGRARRYLDQNQRLMASDVIFTEGIDGGRALASAVEDARAAEADYLVGQEEAARRTEIWAAVSAIGACLIAMLILVPLPGQMSSSAESSPESAAASTDPSELYLTDQPRSSLQQPATASSLDFSRMAALCTEFGRVGEAGELSGLLDQSRDILKSSGLIVWLTDSLSSTLRPALSSGYGRDQLSRIGGIPYDAQNATAAAYRRQQSEMIDAAGGGSAAIVVPILSPSGCLGVLTLELKLGVAATDALCSSASIVASQLAGLVGPLPSAPDIATAQA